MRTNSIILVNTFVALLLVGPYQAWAQMTWDAGQYSQWVAEGRESYEQAQQLPVEARQRRQELLLQSAQAKLAARELLRGALASGQVEPDFQEQAINELFNLGENLVVTLLDLDQCEAAALFLDQMELERVMIPPDGLVHLERIRPLIDECRERNRPEAPAWDEARFAQLVHESRQWRDHAQSGRDPLLESIQREQAALDMLRTAVLSGGGVPGIARPEEALFEHYGPMIEGLVALGFCEMAERRLAWRDLDAQVLNRPLTASELELNSLVSGCSSSQGTDSTAGCVTRVVSARERDPWPYLLLFTSAAAGVVGLAIDLSYEGERASLSQVERECAAGPCDYERGLELADSIDQAKWAARGMAATAIVAGVIGLVWLIAGGDSGEEAGPPVGLGPSPPGADVGVSFVLPY